LILLNEFQKIVFIGAGNVASHLGKALKDAGNEILQVYSRTEKSASLLAQKLETTSTSNISEIYSNADLYVISVSDDNVDQILGKLTLKDKLVVHTSGFLPMDTLKQVSENYGVFYPLQTFSKSREVEMRSVPICIEANTPENLQLLNSLAGQISSDVRQINSDQRKVLHLSAVFACNFPNFMYAIAEKILQNHDMDFSILKPLILETAQKIQELEPANAQTGPAIRGDERVINAHLKMLDNYPAYQKLYQIITDQISDTKKPETNNQ